MCVRRRSSIPMDTSASEHLNLNIAKRRSKLRPSPSQPPLNFPQPSLWLAAAVDVLIDSRPSPFPFPFPFRPRCLRSAPGNSGRLQTADNLPVQQWLNRSGPTNTTPATATIAPTTTLDVSTSV